MEASAKSGFLAEDAPYLPNRPVGLFEILQGLQRHDQIKSLRSEGQAIEVAAEVSGGMVMAGTLQWARREIQPDIMMSARNMPPQHPVSTHRLETLHYDAKIIQALPEPVAASFCGVGNPLASGPIQPGDHILDIGCGAGVDSSIAALMVGEVRPGYGRNLVPEMLERAKENARTAGAANVTFREASAEELPFPDNSFDVVISNGVFNLVVDKTKALGEVYRVLKPGGRFWARRSGFGRGSHKRHPGQNRELGQVERAGPYREGSSWHYCNRQGSKDGELVAETGFNSSPATKGVLFRAVRPLGAQRGAHRRRSRGSGGS